MRRRVLAGLLALLCTLPLTACARHGGESLPTREVSIYYAISGREQAEKGLLGCTAVEVPDDEDIVAHMMKALFSTPEAEGLICPFPRGTHLLRSTTGANSVAVYVSREYGELSGLGETIADYCIVLTLCQLEGVESVSIHVEDGGEKYALRPENVIVNE